MKGLKKNRKEKIEIIREECETCTICQRYKKNPSCPELGLPLARNFNEVVALDIVEIEGKNFIVMIDWATRYYQAKWIKSKDLMRCYKQY